LNLLDKKILLITKSRQDAGESLSALSEAGMDIIYFSTIKIIPIPNSSALEEKLAAFDEFDYLIFTSANAVEVFNMIAQNSQLEFSKVKVAAIGKSTAEKCKQYEINVDIIPDEFSVKGMINKFASVDLTDKKILIPCSSLSRSELELGLSELGAHVTSVPVYNVIVNNPDNLQDEILRIRNNKPDYFVFTSPSSFDNFIEIMNLNDLDEYFTKTTLCAIGTTTEEAIRAKGLTVHIVPQIFSLSGIADAVKKYSQITANMA
jgi:uroporphyrinogen-III synthase